MSRTLALLVRAAVALAIAVPLTGVAAASAAATHAVISTRFFADHQRDCWYGVTEGHIAWNPSHPVERPRVDLAGTVSDRFLSPCVGPDQGPTFAEFTAYARGERVDAAVVYQDSRDGVTRFGISLHNTNDTRNAPIDRVDIRVCRLLGPWLPAFHCGELGSYLRPPVIGPTG